MTTLPLQSQSAAPTFDQPIALDVGGHCIRSMRREGLRLVGRAHRTCYTILNNDPACERELREAAVDFASCEQGLLVPGSSARIAAHHHGRPLLPALVDGIVADGDIVARQVLSLLIDSLTPPCRPGTTASLATSSGDLRTIEFFAGLLELRGYEPRLLTPSLAGGLIAYAETGLTGVVIDAGAECTEIAAIARGRELASTTILAGGRALDQAFLMPEEHILIDSDGMSYRDDEACRILRESYSVDGAAEPASIRLAAHRQLASNVADATIDIFEKSLVRHQFRRPTTITLIGGLSNDALFVEQLNRQIAHRDVASYFETPMTLLTDEFIVCRGLLQAAEIETTSDLRRAA